MRKTTFLLVPVLAAGCAATLSAQPRRADIIGSLGDHGKCTVDVVVDGSAEVTVRGDTATLRTLGGRPAHWRRFQCNTAMPPNPVGFRFEPQEGRGRQVLERGPGRGGPVVVRIDDRQGGEEGYKFDLVWDARASGYGMRGPGGDRDHDRGEFHGGPPPRRFTTEQAIRVCQDAVRRQALDRFHARDVTFRRINMDDNPGRHDWVIGVIEVRRHRDEIEPYRFSCSVNFDTGHVRSAEIQPMEHDRRR
jgi:hypothetical protein